MYAPSLFGQQICTGTMEVHEPSSFLLTMQRGILVLENYPNVYKYQVSRQVWCLVFRLTEFIVYYYVLGWTYGYIVLLLLKNKGETK